MKKHVVRVVIPTIDNSPPLAQRIDTDLLECLRYAGVVCIHHDDHDRQTFDIIPPKGIENSVEWAEKVACKMNVFGYNAVSAPEA